MAPLDAQVGDEVYVIPGGRIPFTLRRCEDENKFQIVGGCYVNGMMNGEALRSEKWKEEDICIR
jgi:hypothetical protein